jgi:asparagine synthase (glutamine-hydrolysing)
MAPDFTLALERDPFLDLRLVEFIFAIPTLPWLFQKDILRRSMAPLLPHKIIKRPKTPLGDLGSSLSAKLENSWINDWTPSNNLFQYVKSVPFLKAGACVENSEAEFLKRRLIVLDNWIDRIKS